MSALARLALLMMIAAAMAWRPEGLGFFYDDWAVEAQAEREGAFLSWARWDYLWAQYHTRPVLSLAYWLGSGLCGSNPAAWQCLSLMLNIGIALAMAAFTRALLDSMHLRGTVSGLGGDVAATCWLIFPWLLGFTAWVTSSINGLAMLFVLPAFTLVLRYPAPSHRQGLAAAALFLLGCLSYEAVYFSYASLLLFVWIADNTPVRRDIWRWVGWLSVAQALAIGWNRLQAMHESAFNKHINEKGLRLFAHDYAYFWPKLSESFQEHSHTVAISASYVLLITVLLMILNYQRRELAALWAMVLSGILGAGLLFAMAGYGLFSVGDKARTAVMIGFWLAPLLGVIFGYGWYVAMISQAKNRRASVLLCVFVLYLMGLLTHATWLRGEEWRQAWTVQKQVLESWPGISGPFTPSDRFVFVGPSSAPIGVFEAPWTMGGFINYAKRQGKLQGKPTIPVNMVERWMSAEQPGWRLVWDGKMLKQSHCDMPDQVLFTNDTHADVYVWKISQEPAPRKVTQPFDAGCGKPSPF